MLRMEKGLKDKFSKTIIAEIDGGEAFLLLREFCAVRVVFFTYITHTFDAKD